MDNVQEGRDTKEKAETAVTYLFEIRDKVLKLDMEMK